jgi:hypothetical protein
MAKHLTPKGKFKTGSPGPNPQRLSLEQSDWKKFVSMALQKKCPRTGWPNTEKI